MKNSLRHHTITSPMRSCVYIVLFALMLLAASPFQAANVAPSNYNINTSENSSLALQLPAKSEHTKHFQNTKYKHEKVSKVRRFLPYKPKFHLIHYYSSTFHLFTYIEINWLAKVNLISYLRYQSVP